MKTYNGILKAYSIDELSESARQKAYKNWYANRDDSYNSEKEATLKEFCEIFDITVTSYSYDEYRYNFDFEIDVDIFKNINGIRLAKYIWNNYASYIEKGKYYSLSSKTAKNKYNRAEIKNRHSKVFLIMNDCPLTGVCFDCDILDSIIDCLHYKKLYKDYQELICECLNKFFKACVQDTEYCNSMEYFIEENQNMEYEFDINGNNFYLPDDFEEAI